MFERVVLMVMGVVIVLEVVEVIAHWHDGVKSGLGRSWGEQLSSGYHTDGCYLSAC